MRYLIILAFLLGCSTHPKIIKFDKSLEIMKNMIQKHKCALMRYGRDTEMGNDIEYRFKLAEIQDQCLAKYVDIENLKEFDVLKLVYTVNSNYKVEKVTLYDPPSWSKQKITDCISENSINKNLHFEYPKFQNGKTVPICFPYIRRIKKHSLNK